jgi:hypothetical protein
MVAVEHSARTRSRGGRHPSESRGRADTGSVMVRHIRESMRGEATMAWRLDNGVVDALDDSVHGGSSTTPWRGQSRAACGVEMLGGQRTSRCCGLMRMQQGHSEEESWRRGRRRRPPGSGAGPRGQRHAGSRRDSSSVGVAVARLGPMLYEAGHGEGIDVMRWCRCLAMSRAQDGQSARQRIGLLPAEAGP